MGWCISIDVGRRVGIVHLTSIRATIHQNANNHAVAASDLTIKKTRDPQLVSIGLLFAVLWAKHVAESLLQW